MEPSCEKASTGVKPEHCAAEPMMLPPSIISIAERPLWRTIIPGSKFAATHAGAACHICCAQGYRVAGHAALLRAFATMETWTVVMSHTGLQRK